MFLFPFLEIKRLSRGREYLVKYERSEIFYLVTRDRYTIIFLARVVDSKLRTMFFDPKGEKRGGADQRSELFYERSEIK